MPVVPARTASTFQLNAGEAFRVINTYGTQVADIWLIASGDGSQYASMAHTRAATLQLAPKIGDRIFSNRRQPLATVVEDTSGGVHDTLIAACDRERYAMLGHQGPHDNCADNFATAIAAAGLSPMPVPDPFNVFMNVPVQADGSLAFLPPVSGAGSHLTVVADTDLVLVVSACPQDLLPVNGLLQTPRDVEVQILSGPAHTTY
jgi:uncharacterized protein YcgI (DUF1989 family)